MLTIRFFRTGKRNQPFFRIVVTDKRNAPRGGRFLEVVGFFNPRTKEKQLKAERVKHWLSVGAKPSDRAHNLLVSEGILQAKKKPAHTKPKKKAGGEKAPAAVRQPSAEQPQTRPEENVEEKPEVKSEEKPAEEKLSP